MTDDEKNTEKRRKLSNLVESLQSSKSQANRALAQFDADFSRLRMLVPDLTEDSIEWHERLTTMMELVTVGKASWHSADHYLANTLARITKELRLDEV